MSDMAKCEICGAEVHIISKHLEEAHPEVTLDQYRKDYPDAAIYSAAAKEQAKILQKKQKKASNMNDAQGVTRKAFHEVFDIPKPTKENGALNKAGKPIPIMVMDDSEDEFTRSLVPQVDDNYIFNVDLVKTLMMGVECNIPVYLAGHAGTGKSTMPTQACARTNRPMIRVQHTGNTEEAHILGQTLVKDGATYWEPGPLQLAMKYGWTYLADEYDRALPQVLSVYQPVIEVNGKGELGTLVTKEAPPEWRIIKPHPDFRFVATGNTNGAGDSTGLFPSTALQDFANYERFGLMLKVEWMPEKQEIAIVAGQAGIPQEDAKALVRFARDVRKQVDAGSISAPPSPRALINAGKIGVRFRDYAKAIDLAYIHRLNETDAEACRQFSQRIWGS